MASIFETSEPLDFSRPIFPYNPYYGQVYYDGQSKKTYEYLECGEGSTDKDGLPVYGYWQEIDWNYERT
tara:strand:+ start:411 stop:617 length:207 start_codon:yes stop_codon:yes gene_type:complete